MTPAGAAKRLAVYSGAGWLIDSAARGEPARSVLWRGAAVPMLPIYGAGALLALALAAGPLAGQPWYVRGAAYAGTLSMLEWLSCYASRALFGRQSWSYDERGTCVDASHALVWGALGLALEQIDPALFDGGK